MSASRDSAATPALLAALLLGWAAPLALAGRDTEALDDGVSLMQLGRQLAGRLSRDPRRVGEACQPVQLTAPDTKTLGNSVSFGPDSAFVAAGARYSSDFGTSSGSAFVFDPATGHQVVKLLASDGTSGDTFGCSVSISSNTSTGARIVVGARGEDDRASNAGAVYVFDAASGAQLAKLTAPDGDSNDFFGSSVSINPNGTIVAVGATGDEDNGDYAGSVYVLDVATGAQLAKLTALDGAAHDNFGCSVSLSSDGARVAVGSNKDDDHGSNSGSAYVFDVATGAQLAKLTAPDGDASDEFGFSVSIDSSGRRVAVGSHRGGIAGSVYVFDIANGTQLVKLTAQDEASNLVLGCSVSISADGERVAAGARGADSRAGSAYLFDVATGSQLLKLTAPDRASEDSFGNSVSISSDGAHVAVAAYYDDDVGSDSGSVYLFDARTCPTPAPQAPTISPTAGPTPSPTAPTSSPTLEASATGDPHVTNVDGARFEIRAGVHEFLRLPRLLPLQADSGRASSAEPGPEPLLSVSAAVQGAGEDECHESYVKQVDVMGEWLRSSGPLRFGAGGGGLGSAEAIALSVNGSQVETPGALGRDGRVQPFLEVTERVLPRADRVLGAIQKVPMLTVKLSFPAATLQIDWMHRVVPGAPPLNHLNFQALGLRRFLESSGMDIGGILGRDDHTDAASLPASCKPLGADLRVSNRVPGERGELQVIAAAL